MCILLVKVTCYNLISSIQYNCYFSRLWCQPIELQDIRHTTFDQPNICYLSSFDLWHLIYHYLFKTLIIFIACLLLFHWSLMFKFVQHFVISTSQNSVFFSDLYLVTSESAHVQLGVCARNASLCNFNKSMVLDIRWQDVQQNTQGNMDKTMQYDKLYIKY